MSEIPDVLGFIVFMICGAAVLLGIVWMENERDKRWHDSEKATRENKRLELLARIEEAKGKRK